MLAWLILVEDNEDLEILGNKQVLKLLMEPVWAWWDILDQKTLDNTLVLQLLMAQAAV